MGMQVLVVRETVTVLAQAQYGDEPRFLEHVRSKVARVLAETILRDAAVYHRSELKAEDDPQGGKVFHDWSIGLERDMDEIRAREAQMQEARASERLRIAGILLEAARRYENLTGGCAYVIAGELRDQAKKIQELE